MHQPQYIKENLEYAKKILPLAKQALLNGEVTCKNEEGRIVAQATTPGLQVYLNCSFWRWNDESQAATLVHEATHNGGIFQPPHGHGTPQACFTKDGPEGNTYFWQNNRQVWSGLKDSWAWVASTYDTWILTEFCIPGYNPESNFNQTTRRREAQLVRQGLPPKYMNDPRVPICGSVKYDATRPGPDKGVAGEECKGQHGVKEEKCRQGK